MVDLYTNEKAQQTGLCHSQEHC